MGRDYEGKKENIFREGETDQRLERGERGGILDYNCGPKNRITE